MIEHEKLAHKLSWAPLEENGIPIATLVDDGSLVESQLEEFLSETEILQAAKYSVAKERRHFTLRKCFQRAFVASVIGWDGPLKTLALVHQRDTQPHCPQAPQWHLSFSSSGLTYLAGASNIGPIGIDIERERKIENALQLAERFFSPFEAAALSRLDEPELNRHFLLMWTAKEAALKAIGKGIVSGLNTFTFKRAAQTDRYVIQDAPDSPDLWGLFHLDFIPGHLVAVVKKIVVDKAEVT